MPSFCDFLSIYAQEHRRRGWTDCCELKVQEDQETSTFCTWRTPAVEGPAIQVFVHASVITLAVGRVEARIEAVEEELRLEKQKSAALQQKQMSPSSNAAEICQEGGVVPQCSRCSGKSATAELSDGSGDNSKTSVKKSIIDHHWRSLFIGNFHFCPCLKEPLFSDKDVLTRIAWGRFQRFPWDGQWLAGAWGGVHKVQNRCEVLFKNFPNASEPEVRSIQ